MGIAYIGEPIYGAFITLACVYAAFELRMMLRQGGFAPVDLTLFGVAALVPLNTWLHLPLDGLSLVVLVVIASLALLLVHRTSDRALIDWAVSLGLALYVGGLMQFYMPLRAFVTTFPGAWVWALLILSWVCDSSAFFVGGKYGHTPLAPTISPKKSVEGAVAGLIAPTLVGPLLALALGLNPLVAAGYGLAIAAATIVGDLVESFVKRQTGVKDSGILIPGHGGLLDRMDSLLFCAPIAVLYLHAIGA